MGMPKTLLLLIVFGCFGTAYGANPATCQDVFKRVVKPYKKLFMKLPKSTMLDSNQPVVKMVTFKENLCSGSSTIRPALNTIVKALSEHSAKIGVLLPLSGLKGPDGQAILDGIKTVYPFRKIQYEQRIVARDTRGMVHSLEVALADMVFKHRVSILVGGFSKAEASVLEKWGARLRIPTIIVNKKMNPRVLKHVFHVFPSELNLVDRLADHAKAKGYKKVALLHPINNKGRKFSNLLSKRLEDVGISTEHDYIYNDKDYETMHAAAKKIFKIDPVERADEFQKLVKKAKEKALDAGVPFNPSLVALNPIVEVDAIFIDDNFRTVRHFTKLFEFLGVKHINLLGTPQWRARGLIDPPEPTLEGASFVDYIGDYRKLPRGIAAPTLESPYFVRPDLSSRVDYMVIGHHAAKSADRALSLPILKRRLMYKRFRKLTHRNDPYFGNGKVFDKGHKSTWPTFMFQVGGGEIVPIRSSVGNLRQARSKVGRGSSVK